MLEFLESYAADFGLNLTEASFAFMLVLVSLIMLYAIAMIHHQLRLIESELHNLKNEQTLQSEELESLAQWSADSAKPIKLEIPDP